MGIISIYIYNNILGYLYIEYKNKNKLYIKEKIKKIKEWSLIINSINIIIIGWILLNFNRLEKGYQYIENIININWGIDGISLIFIILIVILGPITIISNWNNIKKNEISYIIIINLLLILMTLNFLCLNLITFYILFECTLAPLFILIGLFGTKNKEEAAYSVLLYTLFSSLFMLLSIIIYKIILNTTDYIYINNILLSLDIQNILFIGIMLGIGIKTPLIPIHTWLPLVHSESPLGGSILLAGIILKIAIYGIIRLILPNLPEITFVYLPLLFLIGFISIIYSSLVTLVQIDLKVIIAYSSISHLAICFIGIFSNNILGLNGSLVLSIAHGLVSPALFILVGGILYDRYHKRLFNYYQGLIAYIPLFCFYLVIFSFANTGTPLSINFIGEFLSLSGAIFRHPFIGSICVISVLLSACYQMKLTNKLTNGSFSSSLAITNDLTSREFVILNLLVFFTLLFGIFPNLILSLFYFSTSNLLFLLF